MLQILEQKPLNFPGLYIKINGQKFELMCPEPWLLMLY